MRKMAEEWARFRESTTPNASADDVRLMRKCFYIGAISLANLIITHMSEGASITDADDAFIADVLDELASWKAGAQ